MRATELKQVPVTHTSRQKLAGEQESRNDSRKHRGTETSNYPPQQQLIEVTSACILLHQHNLACLLESPVQLDCVFVAERAVQLDFSEDLRGWNGCPCVYWLCTRWMHSLQLQAELSSEIVMYANTRTRVRASGRCFFQALFLVGQKL